MFRSLLVPLDGSSFSENALPCALNIAKRSGAAVQLLHVHVPLLYTTGASAVDSGGDESVWKQERAYLDQTIARWQVAAPGVRMSSAVLEGLVPDALREQMSGKAELMVLTTHGRGPASRFWLGSAADDLVQTATVPMLVLRPSEQPPPLTISPPFHHMMITLDGSDLAEQAFGPALQLGRLMQTRYTLLRVVKPVVSLDPTTGWSATNDMNEPQARQQLDEAQAYLDRIAERLRGQGLTVQTRLTLHTRPADAILEETAKQGVDVIALATHGRGGLQRLLLGSVADEVLRGGTTPLLICRPQIET